MPHRLPALALVLTLSVLLFAACKKDDPETLRPRYRSMLTAGPWKLYAYTRFVRVDDNRVDTTDIYKGLPTCDTDNVYTFTTVDSNAKGTLLIDEGLTKCDSTNPQSRPSMLWEIPYADATTMILSDGLVGDIFTLNQLTDSVLYITKSLSFDARTNKIEGRRVIYHRAF